MTDKQRRRLRLIGRLSRGLDYLVLVLSLLALLLGAYAFWDTHQVLDMASTREYAGYKPDSRDRLSFEELKRINPDLVGWIDIYGTQMDYPIVQGEDNSEYLNTTVLGEFSTGGSIFLDYRNEKDFSDFQNIVYGHYMAKRKMFGDVELFKDQDFFDSHRYGVIHRVGGKSLGIDIFAYMKTVGTDPKLLSPSKTRQEKEDLIDYIYQKATYSRRIDFEEGERLVVLDTCDLSRTNGRYILLGKLTDRVEKNLYEDKVERNEFSQFLDRAYKFDLLILSLIIWILLVVIYLVYEVIRRKKKEEVAETNVQKKEK